MLSQSSEHTPIRRCDLEHFFGKLADEIPTSTAGSDNFIFSCQTLPVPPAHLVTDRLVIRKQKHAYQSWFRADALWFQAHKSTYRQLGLLILAVIFHPTPSTVHLELTHPASDIKNVRIEFEYRNLNEIYPGYSTHPYALNYYPEEMEWHPWHNRHPNPADLPCFMLTNRHDLVVTEEDWENRDTIIGFGNDEGSVRFAELLLNASCPQNSVNEYVLEGEAGFRGVGEHSAEVRLFLPGSLGWDAALMRAD